MLCEKALVKRLMHLLDRGINDNEIDLIAVGRHFLIDGVWVIVGRNHIENTKLQGVAKVNEGSEAIVANGPTILILDDYSKKEGFMARIDKLIEVYTQKDLEARKEFDEFKL